MSKSAIESFFAEVAARCPPQSADSLMHPMSSVKRFFQDCSRRLDVDDKRQRALDRKEATGFNVFDLISPDENKLSDILADLLDPDGSHGQCDLFLRLLMQKLGFATDANLLKNVTIQREAPTFGIQKYRRRIDVLVDASVLIAIENKVDSAEQAIQIKDYLGHLAQCVRGSQKQYVLIYLTPDCRRPDSLSVEEFDDAGASRTLFCWSYQTEIAEWLHVCREKCEASKIRHFLSDFITHIERKLKREMQTEREEL